MSHTENEGGAYEVPRPEPIRIMPARPRPAPGPQESASDTSGSASPGDWPNPEPLRAELPPVELFDPEMVPNAFRAWITDIAERMQCPLDFLGAALLVALAAVVGRRVGICPKRRDEWLVVPNLWGAVVGRPGLLKSPAVEEVLRPLKRLEIEEKKKFEAENLKYMAEQAVEQAKDKEAQKAINKAIADGDEEEAKRIAKERWKEPRKIPRRKRHLLNDGTVEKVGELLNENPMGFLIFRDELMGFVRAMDKDGHECDRAFYLEAWNGTGRFTYDRIGRGTIDIEAACISIFGCIQPGPLSSYLQAAIDFTTADDGFIQRFQVIVWPDVSSNWTNIDRYSNADAKERAYAVFEALERLTPAQLEFTPGKFWKEGDIPGLRFNPGAQKIFDAWRAKLEQRLRSGHEHAAIESHLAKYRSLVPSIALLMHLADGGHGPVEVVDIERALRWAAYLESHARRLYSVGINAEVSAAKAIERHIRKGDLKDGFTLREVYRPKWAGLTRKEDAERGVGLLIELGWLRPEMRRTAGAPLTVHRINPKLNFSAPAQEGTAKSDESPNAEPQGTSDVEDM